MKPQTKTIKTFAFSAVTTLTVLFMLILVIVFTHTTDTQSEMQLWLMGTIPALGVMLLVCMSATLLAGIFAFIQLISKLRK